MQAPIEIRYAGVVVGRVQEVSTSDGDASSYFLPLREPMPVGSVVRLRSGDQETPARVVRAIEAAEASGSGMQVRLIGDAEVVAPEWIPPPAAIVPVKAKPPAPEPIVDTGKAKSRAIAPSASPQEPNTSGDAAAEAVQAAPAQASPPAQADTAQASAVPADAKDVEKPVAAASETPSSDATMPTTSAEAEASSMPATEIENTSKEIAAIPEEVPVAVGSSMTGALENATETAPYGTAVRSRDNSAATRAIPEDSGSASGKQLSFEEPPPARPVASPSGRRRTKRRK